ENVCSLPSQLSVLEQENSTLVRQRTEAEASTRESHLMVEQIAGREAQGSAGQQDRASTGGGGRSLAQQLWVLKEENANLVRQLEEAAATAEEKRTCADARIVELQEQVARLSTQHATAAEGVSRQVSAFEALEGQLLVLEQGTTAVMQQRVEM
ncbi:unnamed protein product, partial [Sphacelaria rigidula]